MTPGPIEETAKVAGGVVDALKSTPAILAVVIFNIMFMGVVTYIQYTNGERWQRLFELTLQQCTVKEAK